MLSVQFSKIVRKEGYFKRKTGPVLVTESCLSRRLFQEFHFLEKDTQAKVIETYAAKNLQLG